MSVPCDLCGSEQSTLLFVNHDRMYRKTNRQFKVIRCSGCGLARLDAIPDEADTKSFYQDDYKPLSLDIIDMDGLVRLVKRMQGTGLSGTIKRILFLLPFRLRFNRTLPRYAPGSRLLDMGCGSGAFLAVAKRMGYDAYGVEPSFSNDDLAKKEGFHVFKGFLRDAGFKDDFFDVVTLNHVIEHTPKPSEVFMEVKRIVKPGGIIIMAQPNSRSPGFWIFGKFWLNTDTPRHIYLPSVKNMCDYAKKSGLDVAQVNFTITPGTYIESLRYVVEDITGKPFRFPSIISKAMVLVLLLPTEFLNLAHLGDHSEIIFRKPN